MQGLALTPRRAATAAAVALVIGSATNARADDDAHVAPVQERPDLPGADTLKGAEAVPRRRLGEAGAIVLDDLLGLGLGPGIGSGALGVGTSSPVRRRHPSSHRMGDTHCRWSDAVGSRLRIDRCDLRQVGRRHAGRDSARGAHRRRQQTGVTWGFGSEAMLVAPIARVVALTFGPSIAYGKTDVIHGEPGSSRSGVSLGVHGGIAFTL